MLSIVVAAFLCAGQAPPPAPSVQPAKRVERPEVRWNRLPPQQKKRLVRAYRELKARLTKEDWARIKELQQANLTVGLENYPPHWRAFLVRNARWAREEIKNLPPEEVKRLMSLPPGSRAAAIKAALQPRFRKHVAECRAAANQVFTPLELAVIKQLPPRERARLMRGNDPFGLISPWSWRRYAELGDRRRLVDEFMSMPEALAMPRDRRAHPVDQKATAGSGRPGDPREEKNGEETRTEKEDAPPGPSGAPTPSPARS